MMSFLSNLLITDHKTKAALNKAALVCGLACTFILGLRELVLWEV